MVTPIHLITSELLDATLDRARRSERKRANYNFHANDESNPHRFLNALVRGTYVPPHRHITPPKSESFLVVRGQIAFFIFDDAGTISHCHRLGEKCGALGVDVAPGLWHSMALLSDSAVVYEVKPGPYAPLSDKDFAPFAPREGDAEASAYLARLVSWAESAR